MSEDEYTPTTDQVREFWVSLGTHIPASSGYRRDERSTEFDRWLAAHDAEVTERAARAVLDPADMGIINGWLVEFDDEPQPLINLADLSGWPGDTSALDGRVDVLTARIARRNTEITRLRAEVARLTTMAHGIDTQAALDEQRNAARVNSLAHRLEAAEAKIAAAWDEGYRKGQASETADPAFWTAGDYANPYRAALSDEAGAR